MKKLFFGILWLALLPIVGVQAQIYDQDGQYVDTVFHDHVNRQADDFVKAYLCIAEPTDWRDDFLGVNGHAFIRLVCDTFHLDYCYSYESEGVNDQMNKYLQGKLKMGMYAVPTNEYIADYQNWNRAVHQYRLNLPAIAEQRLWEIMDNYVMSGDQLELDLNKRGCAISAVQYIVNSLGDLQIEYPDSLPIKGMTLREIQYYSLENNPWIRLSQDTWLDNIFNQPCSIEGKLIIPSDVAEVWQQSTLLGKPVLEYDCDIVDAPIAVVQKPFVTPLRLAWCLLVITILLSLVRLKKPSFELFQIWLWIWLSLLVMSVGVFIYLWCATGRLPYSSMLLIAIFNVGPIVFWRWRTKWQLPYAIALFVGASLLSVWPHMVIDPFYIVLSLNYAVLFAFNR